MASHINVRVGIEALAWFYLVTVIIAELLTALVDPVIGVAVHLVVFGAILVHSTSRVERLPLLGLSLVPLIRIVSLGLPLSDFDQRWWLYFTSVPLLAAVVLVSRSIGLTRADLGIRLPEGWGWPASAAVAASGLGFGWLLRQVLERPIGVGEPTTGALLLFAGALIVGASLVDELIFRGALQSTSIGLLGVVPGILFASFAYATMQVGNSSMLPIALTFVFGLYVGLARYRLNSLIGPIAANVAANLVFFEVIL
jgi:uncharacterized protein